MRGAASRERDSHHRQKYKSGQMAIYRGALNPFKPTSLVVDDRLVHHCPLSSPWYVSSSCFLPTPLPPAAMSLSHQIHPGLFKPQVPNDCTMRSSPRRNRPETLRTDGSHSLVYAIG
ncbi:hypothetical protein BDN71DRAFT_364770 [Pleurotus eryngii]|uniref:Uncharacterized protein n=1 Tax=Pleurotus eryngii TaxID=5323 RepID=A0A9P5ZNP2_PLEER|nr:hypothetical protein BDN71DRAFT_364770 [Pleurotus eryngii]